MNEIEEFRKKNEAKKQKIDELDRQIKAIRKAEREANGKELEISELQNIKANKQLAAEQKRA